MLSPCDASPRCCHRHGVQARKKPLFQVAAHGIESSVVELLNKYFIKRGCDRLYWLKHCLFLLADVQLKGGVKKNLSPEGKGRTDLSVCVIQLSLGPTIIPSCQM